jgi:hypothetical protein
MVNPCVETTFQPDNVGHAKAGHTIFKWLWRHIHTKGTNTTGIYEKILSPVPDTPMHMKSCNISSKPTQLTRTHHTKEMLHNPAPTPIQTLWGDYVRFEDTSIQKSLKNVYNSVSNSILRITPDENEPIRAKPHHVTWTSSVIVYCIPALTRITRNERRACKDKLTVTFKSVVHVREIPARMNDDGIDRIR